jgi:putative ABC transport system permease protein
MLRNYLIIAYRNLWRNKGFTLISSLGLALGISCALLLFLLIDFHLSYDQHHSKIERIFRINSEELLPNGDIDYSSGTPFPMAEAVKNDFPELEAVSPIYLSDDASI